jgi:hypothetical protein
MKKILVFTVLPNGDGRFSATPETVTKILEIMKSRLGDEYFLMSSAFDPTLFITEDDVVLSKFKVKENTLEDLQKMFEEKNK